MKLTNKQIQDSIPGLLSLSKVKMPAKAAFIVAKATKKLQEIGETLDGTIKGLWDKYADKNEDGTLKIEDNRLTFSKDNFPKFQEEVKELMAVENPIDGLRQLTLVELADAEVDPAMLMALDWLIAE